LQHVRNDDHLQGGDTSFEIDLISHGYGLVLRVTPAVQRAPRLLDP
jgi:hypothetical protein